ncbi:polysaccharide biosynthesis C-terminal domain-containing protein [Tenacibaculum aquimarinum]|uniref:polysaccharide biosynthesis C-terminal domain-containing protein n=1 Tax=Tenacibaculum aquimarinum TaxID=2910675 RepID=UPI001F0B11F7|nr:polysaccharide biosynthesis C-terminal domain-containing protein [Tenacibaculum aquimarinum]MCH3883752.1 polysaccharide biosynthesis C-terminal domain-containing protein [Tenacibaculum aquimarinum]
MPFAIIGPKIAELFWSKKTYELRKLFMSSLKMIFFATLPVFIAVLFFPSFFLSIFNLSANFTLELIIMLVGQFLYGITAIFGLFLMVTDKQKMFRNIYIVSAILNLILCFVLIPKYGVLGASITVAVSYVFLNVLCMYSFYKRNLLI